MDVAVRLSLQEFLSNPDIHYYDFHELHNGEVVVVSPPSEEHVDLQDRLEGLLRSALGPEFITRREFYITLATESRRIDVAAVRQHRWAGGKKVFSGAPDLAIEILSPSNTALDVDHLRSVCLEHGTRQFWVINMELKTITVYKAGRSVALFDRESPAIALDELRPGAAVSVADVFAGLSASL